MFALLQGTWVFDWTAISKCTYLRIVSAVLSSKQYHINETAVDENQKKITI
jgi:hypothetical protein